SLTEVSQQKSKLKKAAANILFFNAFIKRAKAIQCLSEAEKESTKVKNQKFVSSNGVYMPEKIKKDFLQNEGMKFIYIGRLEYYYKGLDLLISAVRLCADFLKENKCKFYIYGTDKNGRFEHIKSLTEENGVTDLVELNHGIFGEEKENELLSSDCFIQTSRSEGMPLGILEAFSYGIPCLVTYGTRLGEAVKSNDLGWACDADEADIASTIRQAVNERYTLVSKSLKAVDYIQKNYEWDLISSNAVKIYGSLIKDKEEVYTHD
ncbi:MAG: glycosyltransferase, partial [Clostridia bacterium]|nr:glycosyltransferase [Clostridia bacterium]